MNLHPVKIFKSYLHSIYQIFGGGWTQHIWWSRTHRSESHSQPHGTQIRCSATPVLQWPYRMMPEQTQDGIH